MARGKRVDELLGVLWAYRTTSKRPTRVTSFAFAYRMKVVIPIDIELPMVRTTMPESKTNKENVEVQLDWADEEHEALVVQLASYQQRTMTHYKKRAHPRLFRPGDMVLR